MGNDVPGHQLQALVSAHNGFQLRPFGLEPLLALHLFPLGGLLELRVDGRLLFLVQGQLGESALVVDGDGCLVLDRALDVVDADVFSKDGAGVGVLQFDGGPGEANEGCAW